MLVFYKLGIHIFTVYNSDMQMSGHNIALLKSQFAHILIVSHLGSIY